MSEKPKEKIENQSERKSGVVRVVEVNPEAEEAILKIFGQQFSLDNNKFPLEKEKSNGMNEIIFKIGGYLKDFTTRYGAKPLDIPPENIHILDEAVMTPEQRDVISKKFNNIVALFSFEDQHIFFLHVPSWASNFLGFATLVSHEMLHNVSFQSAELELDEDSKLKGLKIIENREDGSIRKFLVLPRRIGLRIFNTKNGTIFFDHVDEAIISELASRFDREYFSQISLISESEEYKNRKGKQEISEAFSRGLTYEQERDKLNKLIDEIFEKNKDKFGSREDVFAIFAIAVMTGRLLPVARLIEKTFGKGSFRGLGENSGVGFDKEKNKQE